MGMMKGGKSNARHTSRAYSLRLNGTALGQVIPLIYGQTRTTPKLIWANDFNATQVSSGKKSGKSGSGVFTYTVAADFLVGHRPLRGCLTIWADKTIWALQYCDQTFVCPSDGVITIGDTPNVVFVGFPKGTNGEQYTIPGSPYQITVAHAAAFMANTRVIYDVSQAVLDQVPVGSTITQGQYSVSSGGVYTFSPDDAGKVVDISYTYNGGGSGPPVVYVLAVTAEMPINVTFNDYGAPGPRTVVGTSALPLWDARFSLPIDDRDTDPALPSTSPNNRLPYTYVPNLGPLQPGNGTVTIANGNPGPLVGKNITVYLAFQFPDPTTGLGTPLANMNLAWEPILACSNNGAGGDPIPIAASEYVNHPDQWCPFTYLTGAGGPDFSLGESDTLPNMSFETIGFFQLCHARDLGGTSKIRGGACPADVLQDLCSSGPVVIIADSHV